MNIQKTPCYSLSTVGPKSKNNTDKKGFNEDLNKMSNKSFSLDKLASINKDLVSFKGFSEINRSKETVKNTIQLKGDIDRMVDQIAEIYNKPTNCISHNDYREDSNVETVVYFLDRRTDVKEDDAKRATAGAACIAVLEAAQKNNLDMQKFQGFRRFKSKEMNNLEEAALELIKYSKGQPSNIEPKINTVRDDILRVNAFGPLTEKEEREDKLDSYLNSVAFWLWITQQDAFKINHATLRKQYSSAQSCF